MQIAYLSNFDTDSSSGVYKKIRSQVQEWTRLGHDVGVFQLTQSDDDSTIDRSDVHYSISYSSKIEYLQSGYQIRKSIQEWNPDLIYYRGYLYLPMLAKLFGLFPTVLEINSDSLAESPSQFSMNYIYKKLTSRFILRTSVGAVFISHELSNNTQFADYSLSKCVIANGIDLSQYQILPSKNNDTPRLVYIGSDKPWHGVDKILELARLRNCWKFDLIGVQETDRPTAPNNVTCHGRLSQSEYQPLFERSDVALGTLALHRNDMFEASPLKVREYLAYGIPTIICYRDTDFLTDSPEYLLELPNNELNIFNNIDQIDSFVHRWKGNRVPRAHINHVDLAEKEQQRVQFFNKIIEDHKVIKTAGNNYTL